MNMAQPARLTAELLARKGQALPTGGFAHAKLDLVPAQPSAATLEQQRCGTSLTREALLPDLRRPAPRHEPGRRPEHLDDERVALTLRLDRARYTRLKILAARRARSGHEVLLSALDAYLEACAADCACLRREARHDPAN
jgi:hypothetical protein